MPPSSKQVRICSRSAQEAYEVLNTSAINSASQLHKKTLTLGLSNVIEMTHLAIQNQCASKITLRLFNHCSTDVKIALFPSYSILYLFLLSRLIDPLQVSYNDSFDVTIRKRN